MSTASEQEGRFMVAVGAMIEHESSGKIFLAKRADTADYLPGIWEDIGGRIKQFEEPEEALRREVSEETGLDIEILKPLTIFHDYRGKRIAENELLIITYWCKARSNQVVLSNEHSAYQWVSPEEALELVEHIGVRRDIQALIAEIS
jgi:8-oxo-dGTP pyrophosphatase MutT (NUDIX family)